MLYGRAELHKRLRLARCLVRAQNKTRSSRAQTSENRNRASGANKKALLGPVDASDGTRPGQADAVECLFGGDATVVACKRKDEGEGKILCFKIFCPLLSFGEVTGFG